MTGCRCITIDPGDALDPGLGGASIIDTSGCSVHPVFCEGLHPTLGVGCEGHPGHGGQHFTLATWPSEQAEREPKAVVSAVVVECLSSRVHLRLADGTAACGVSLPRSDAPTWNHVTCRSCATGGAS